MSDNLVLDKIFLPGKEKHKAHKNFKRLERLLFGRLFRIFRVFDDSLMRAH